MAWQRQQGKPPHAIRISRASDGIRWAFFRAVLEVWNMLAVGRLNRCESRYHHGLGGGDDMDRDHQAISVQIPEDPRSMQQQDSELDCSAGEFPAHAQQCNVMCQKHANCVTQAPSSCSSARPSNTQLHSPPPVHSSYSASAMHITAASAAIPLPACRSRSHLQGLRIGLHEKYFISGVLMQSGCF